MFSENSMVRAFKRRISTLEMVMMKKSCFQIMTMIFHQDPVIFYNFDIIPLKALVKFLTDTV